MTHDQFIETIASDRPMGDLSETLTSLWCDKKNWDRAHSMAQQIATVQGSAVHAYLHREEVVIWNADFGIAGRVESDPIRRLRWGGGLWSRRCWRYDN